MKVDLPTESAVGTLSGERIDMDLDRSAISHLMRVLTRLYEDPELACIREYSTNARDSHIESGQTRPIEITLPTTFNPVLTIQDWGLGMDKEDLTRTYSQYGASTKRDSDDFNGMLGLGSKSALAYTDQFSLETVKDGVLYSVIVFKDSGNPAMKIVDSYTTDLPNGVKVEIPATIYNGMTDKARAFFQYWEPGLVLINGEAPTPLQGLRVSDTFTLVRDHTGYEQDRVVMGGVPYPTTSLQIDKVKPGHQVVVRLGMNEVSFTPNRESLELDRKTNKRIIALREQFPLELAQAVQTAIQDAETPHEAVSGALRFSHAVDFMPEVTFRGKRIPDNLIVTARISEINSDPLRKNQLVHQVPPLYWNTSIWVVGFKSSQYSAVHKKKMRKWLEGQDIDAANFIMVSSDDIDDEWIEPSRIVKWEEISKIKLPSNPRSASGSKGATGPGRLKGSYDMEVIENGVPVYKDQVPADEISQKTNQLFYMNPRSYRLGIPELIRAGYLNATIVVMGEHRFAKFKRDFPKAKSARTHVEMAFEKWSQRIRPKDYVALALESDYQTKRILEKIDLAKVLDPEFKTVAEAAKMKTRVNKQMITAFHRYGHKLDTEEFPKFGLCERYPLIGTAWRSTTDVEHNTIYVNAVWTAEQEK